MMLIDLLVQELPKRGGWPVSVSLDFIQWCNKHHLKFEVNHDNSFVSDLEGDYVSFLGYQKAKQAALAAAQQQVWNGEGLPPVGMHCEIVDPDGALMYGKGESGEVVAHVEDTAVIRMSYGLGCFQARCLRTARSETDKKRDAAISAIDATCLLVRDASTTAAAIYDAIAAGEIPGVHVD